MNRQQPLLRVKAKANSSSPKNTGAVLDKVPPSCYNYTVDHVDQLTLDRFWAKVEKTQSGCWLFRNGIARHDYGTFGFMGKVRKAHIVSWIIHNGEIASGLYVCHKCDNPPCVNPDHLFLGTHSENIKDAYSKGRVILPPQESLLRGVAKRNHKLNDDLVREIRNKYATGNATYRSLSKDYGVDTRTIGHIIHRRKWNHVK